jgi:predicted MFS family arabinose efflux permease
MGLQTTAIFSCVQIFFKGNSLYYSFILAIMGLGGLIGALTSTKYGNVVKNENYIPLCYIIIGLLYILFSLSKNFPLELLICLFIGFFTVISSSLWMTVFHSSVSQKFKGRVFSFLSPIYSIASTSSLVLSSFISKQIAFPIILRFDGCFMIIYLIIVTVFSPTSKYFVRNYKMDLGSDNNLE